jgi:ATP-dependent Lon protease
MAMFFQKKSAQSEPVPGSPGEESPLPALHKRVAEANLPRHAAEALNKEIEKLQKMDPVIAEFALGLNYIDMVLTLPWHTSTQGNLDIKRAQSLLDGRHCGLTQVKQRILEFLAARTLREAVRQTVLIVDDEEIARSNISHILSKAGFLCIPAINGVTALEILAKEDIDLVISDLKMDRMDGLELLAEIGRSYQDIPVILVTGFATVDSAVKALKSGAAHYLGKPLNLGELRETVREVLEQKQVAEIGKGPVLCFTGPPGTGKTSVGKAIAEALRLHFIRVSLAGLRDEAELRGHRRTYVGAMPGRIIMELKRAGVNNPVFMLDEIDKIGQDFRGDPASVMLEVLDPEQNAKFMDHYLDMPFNLSRIMFIATANDVTKLPGPLLDRMELIEFSGYADNEKLAIARTFIVPRQLKAAGLEKDSTSFTDEALSQVITGYTKESGLRNLEREIATICRKLALEKIQTPHEGKQAVRVETATIVSLLGPRRFHRDAAELSPRVGVTTGLVWSPYGGEIMHIETASMQGTGNLLLTGSLGEVLQESAQAALSLIRSRSVEFGIADQFFRQLDIHIHFPAGAVSKDGPSAGIAIFTALLSLLTGRPVRGNYGMTGEMSLRGRLLPVSGIREKLLAAQRAGLTGVFLPLANKEDVDSLPQDVRHGLDICAVQTADEVIEKILLPNRQK